jgi:hypothetical protein
VTSFYVEHSKWSDCGPFRGMIGLWGDDLGELSRSIGGLLRHPLDDTVPLTEAQRQDLLLRSASELLAASAQRRADAAASGAARKIGGVCRDFALLGATALRERKVPARLRVGFADYLRPGFFESHWVCEWHDGSQWRLLDVQAASKPVQGASYAFDPMDVPRDRFLLAADAWRLTKSGSGCDPARFGLSSIPGLRGRWFIASNLLRDEAAVMKVELKPWDVWGDIGRARRLAPAELDGVAAFRTAAERLEALAACDGSDPPTWRESWAPPERVTSYPQGEPLVIRIA